MDIPIDRPSKKGIALIRKWVLFRKNTIYFFHSGYQMNVFYFLYNYWRIFRDSPFLACAFLRKSLLFAKLWHHRTTGHARPRIWAYKLFGEPSLFHCLRHLDADFWRAPISFARVQKPMPANSIIIERAWNATLLLPYHRYWERLFADTRFLSSSTLSARWEPLSLSIEWLICMPSSILYTSV